MAFEGSYTWQLRQLVGDRMQCYALLFEARQWTGDLTPGADEVIQVGFFGPDDLPAR